MKISYSDQPLIVTKPSIFLAGPTPRSRDVQSWRPDAIKVLEELEYEGQVIVPERQSWKGVSYIEQVEWEHEGLEGCSLIVFWIPRDLETMPAFTTNVEFGRYVTSGRILYGRPDNCPNNGYLDWLYTNYNNRLPINDFDLLFKIAVKELQNG